MRHFLLYGLKVVPLHMSQTITYKRVFTRSRCVKQCHRPLLKHKCPLHDELAGHLNVTKGSGHGQLQ